MICNYLTNDPIAVSLIKEVIPTLKSNPLTSALFNLTFGGNDDE